MPIWDNFLHISIVFLFFSQSVIETLLKQASSLFIRHLKCINLQIVDKFIDQCVLKVSVVFTAASANLYPP